MDELLSDFLSETVDALATIDNDLVRWERDPGDRATLDAIFRLVHTIKGTCGFLDLPRLEELAHATETLLGRVREGVLAVSTPLVTEVMAAIDAIKALVAALGESGIEQAGDDAALISRLERIAEGGLVGDDTCAAEPAADQQPAQTIRVPLALIDRLMDTVSELVLARNRFGQLSREGQPFEILSLHFKRLSQCITAIQDGVMRTRMQPIGRLWSALPRLVRRLALDLGKQIEIEFCGDDVEVDRQMLELIKDPLAHMVRNAADHGIESPAERIAARKRPAGRIRIEALREGGQIVLTFSDDGCGLDLAALRARAAACGLMSEGEAKRLSNADAARLIFHPGLSTAGEITAISGRGVGMDIVWSNIERIGGSVDVETMKGIGTRLTLRIPLTLAIISALVAGAGGERFIVPQMAVIELVQVGGDGARIEFIHDAPVMRLRGTLLPLVDLAAPLGLPSRGDAAERFVIVAQAAGFRYGLIVDDLFDTEEIVVKPVAPLLAGLPAYAGNAVLGNGAVAMILDVGGIASLAGLQAAEDSPGEPAETDAATQSLVLFRTDRRPLMAVPLSNVERIEELPVAALQRVGERVLTQYRGALMSVVGIDGPPTLAARSQSLLVLNDEGSSIGIAIEAVEDIVDGVFDLVEDRTAGRLGNAIIGGRIAEVIDARHFLGLASPNHEALERAA